MIGAQHKSFAELVGFSAAGRAAEGEVHGTTVLSLRYDEGILTLADRRATAGNLICTTRPRSIALDRSHGHAISGAFGRRSRSAGSSSTRSSTTAG